MFTNCRNAKYQCSVCILGDILKQENQIRHSGLIIPNDMAADKDFERTLHSFLRQFNSV